MLKLDLTNDARKFVVELDAKQFKQVANKVFGLMVDPTPSDPSQLKGFKYRRADIGEYRIIYWFDEETLFVVLIGKRDGDDVYKRLKRK